LKTLRVGTRGSKLALWQAEHVKRILCTAIPDLHVEIKVIKTTGDKILDVGLSKIGDKGLFTKEIEKELLLGTIDIAVHSMKDLPSQLEDEFCIGAVLSRENPQDVLISSHNLKFGEMPAGAIIGTSSLRRRAQIKAVRPDINLVDIRGNVETRIRKMKEQGMDGIVLAYAGVKRLGYEDLISDFLPYEIFLPAVAQGVIAVETRKGDTGILDIIGKINDQRTWVEVEAERSFMAQMEGGCQVPVAAIAGIQDERLVLQGLVSSLDGKRIFRAQLAGSMDEAEQLGKKLGMQMLESGAGQVLEEIRTMGAD